MKKTFASISELKKLSMSKLEKQAREHRIKPVDKLTLADDYLFGEVMHKKEVCAGVVERLLGIKAGKIIYPELHRAKASCIHFLQQLPRESFAKTE